MTRSGPNSRHRRTLAGFVIVIAMAFHPSLPAAPPDIDPEGQAAEPGLQFVQAEIRDGFASGDPERLAGTLPQRVKTYISCRPIDVGDGYYGTDQLRLLFRRMFRARQTVRFVISEPALTPRPDGRAVAVADWRYRESGGATRESRIAFTLALEGPDWRVREIRDLK
jgi:hypothetical protein